MSAKMSQNIHKRALLLVMDGLGIGAMPDAPAAQKGSNTVRHIVAPEQQALFPTLSTSGLFDAAEGRTRSNTTFAALGYPGADSYLGHNELLGGSAPDTQPDTVRGRYLELVTALRRAGFTLRSLADDGALWVNEGILVSDNLENEPGMAINLAATLDVVDSSTLYRAAEIVRCQVRNPRVIAFASPQMAPADILAAVHRTPGGLTGIVTPEVGFYKEGYQVRHLGIGFSAQHELPYILVQAGYSVELIGKIADVAAGDDAIPRRPIVDTTNVLEDIQRTWQNLSSGLIAATVQETDLAGHAEDAARSFRVLQEVDAWLAQFLPTLSDECLFILTADHGNDPTYGSHHTREYVPVLTYGSLPYALTPMPNLRGVASLLHAFFETDSGM